MQITIEFLKEIKPFRLSFENELFTLDIETRGHLAALFLKHTNEEYEGSGYDWCAIAIEYILVDNELQELYTVYDFIPDNEGFSVISNNFEAIKLFALRFHEIYYNEKKTETLINKMNYW